VLTTRGKSHSSIDEGIKKGVFPAPVKYQGRSAIRLKSEVLYRMVACASARCRDRNASAAML